MAEANMNVNVLPPPSATVFFDGNIVAYPVRSLDSEGKENGWGVVWKQLEEQLEPGSIISKELAETLAQQEPMLGFYFFDRRSIEVQIAVLQSLLKDVDDGAEQNP